MKLEGIMSKPPFMKKPEHILLVDDDNEDTYVFQLALKDIDSKCKLTVTNTGESLLEHLEHSPPPDLIILDLIMPGLSGMECLIKIRAEKKFEGIPVVMLSVLYNPGSVGACLLNGANQYFEKPSSYDGMKQLLKTIYAFVGAIHLPKKNSGKIINRTRLRAAS